VSMLFPSCVEACVAGRVHYQTTSNMGVSVTETLGGEWWPDETAVTC
jgi:hypothetical protein